MCTNRHPEYLCEFLEVLNKKVRAALSVVNHEELLLIRAKLDELIHQIEDDLVCPRTFLSCCISTLIGLKMSRKSLASAPSPEI